TSASVLGWRSGDNQPGARGRAVRVFAPRGVHRPAELALDSLVGALASALGARSCRAGAEQVEGDHDQTEHGCVYAQVKDQRAADVLTQDVPVEGLEERARRDQTEQARGDRDGDATPDEQQGQSGWADLVVLGC